jgi:uncharacterized protein YabE (DUF348 family)
LAQAIRTSHIRGRPVTDARHISGADFLIHPRHFRGRHHAATIFVVVLVAVVAFQVFPQKQVTVLSNGQAYRVSATFDARSEGLAAADVRLQPSDRVLYAEGGGHSSVAIQRARPVIADVDGHQVQLRTQATTIGGALAAAGVTLEPGDLVYLDGRASSARGPLFGVSYASRAAPSGELAADGSAKAVTISVVRARPYTVFVDTLKVDTHSAAENVQGLLEDLGMTVREGDLVRPALDAPLTAGMTVRLAKARTVTVKLNGKDQSLYTQAETVGDVLRLLSIEPAAAELLSSPLEVRIENGMELVIGTTENFEEEIQEAVAPRTDYEDDPTLAPGVVKIIPGREGIRTRRVAVTLRNGVEVDRVLVGFSVTTPATPTRHITGTKPNTTSKPTLTTPTFNGTYTRKLEVNTTWYAPANAGRPPDDPLYGHTATGAMVDYGVCAVDPKVIPMYTRFYVPGYGFCTALDTGGLIVGNIVDLGYPDSHGDPGWGRQTVDIYILD